MSPVVCVEGKYPRRQSYNKAASDLVKVYSFQLNLTVSKRLVGIWDNPPLGGSHKGFDQTKMGLGILWLNCDVGMQMSAQHVV